MSKYIDKDKVLEYIIFGVIGKDITCEELKRGIESLPTIEVNDDTISRADTIKAMCLECWGKGACGADYCTDIEVVRGMPPVEPERLKGEWVRTKNPIGETIVVCSNCGKIRQQGYDDFCGFCGADMRKGSN